MHGAPTLKQLSSVQPLSASPGALAAVVRAAAPFLAVGRSSTGRGGPVSWTGYGGPASCAGCGSTTSFTGCGGPSSCTGRGGPTSWAGYGGRTSCAVPRPDPAVLFTAAR